jgi:DNA-binding CsgD family transcriptional regulator
VDSARLESVADEQQNPEVLLRTRQRASEIRRKLTSRELECLRLRAEGLSYAEIADELDIRLGTVGAMLARVNEKLRWPPGREGVIGMGTAEAVYLLFLGGSPCTTPMWTH